MALHTPLTQLLATVIRSPINKLNTYGTDTVLDKLYEYNVSPLITLEFAFQSIRPYPYTHFTHNNNVHLEKCSTFRDPHKFYEQVSPFGLIGEHLTCEDDSRIHKSID